MTKFDVIVVGSGHAGVEAALASARMGCSTLLLTMSADQIATMSCNPAIGGLGKSQIAKEIDILGGAMCRVADQSAMQYRILNERKGPAVRATRVHVDRHEYRARMKEIVENQDKLQLKQGQVSRLFVENNRIAGVGTHLGQSFFASAVILTTGTFMNGKAHVGKVNFSSGRAGEPPSVGLSDFLRSMGLKLGRFKTGTVPRVDARSIDFSVLEEQPSDLGCLPLSFFSSSLRPNLESAHLAYTNPTTHQIIEASLGDSPLYSGIIESLGPRYCPSVEDKVVRFPSKERHQIFLEKEGRHTNEVYVGGLSTSLPYECQLQFLRSIKGLEKVEIIRPGYAIEYDYLESTQLDPSLSVRGMHGLYFAGQVNGTSGYEEAAAQGLIAGVNAAAFILEKESLILPRELGYIGVLIDDLVHKGTNEPYRMLSSRAEWRLVLREDNVDERLFKYSKEYSLLSEGDFMLLEKSLSEKAELFEKVQNFKVSSSEKLNEILQAAGQNSLKEKVSVADLIRRPGIEFSQIVPLADEGLSNYSRRSWQGIQSNLKYAGYLKQAHTQLRQIERLSEVKIPASVEYLKMQALPMESREKLERFKPQSLAEASRIPGITAASLSVLASYVSRQNENVTCVNE